MVGRDTCGEGDRGGRGAAVVAHVTVGCRIEGSKQQKLKKKKERKKERKKKSSLNYRPFRPPPNQFGKEELREGNEVDW